MCYKSFQVMLKTIVYIAIGGALGSVLRFLTSILVNKYWQSIFPMATFLVNIVGCFLIGFIISFFHKQNLLNSDLKWFLITGFCGGFTTFSAFGLENVRLLENQNLGLSLLYVLTSVIVGIGFVWIGMLTGKAI